VKFHFALKKVYRRLLWGEYPDADKFTPCVNTPKFGFGSPTILQYNSECKLHVGEFCSFGSEVMILLGGEHYTTAPSTYNFNGLTDSRFPESTYSKGDVSIGNDVWVGARATILSGVTIGDGAVVGAGSVVASDVAPYSIVIGNPARLLRMRFNSETVKRLQESKWWQWDISKIKKELYLLTQEN
jgi:acetyltransferase-like isoleucine patch superfamily enzyme